MSISATDLSHDLSKDTLVVGHHQAKQQLKLLNYWQLTHLKKQWVHQVVALSAKVARLVKTPKFDLHHQK
jgi:hypothetical protein